jgi:hypothetical protein
MVTEEFSGSSSTKESDRALAAEFTCWHQFRCYTSEQQVTLLLPKLDQREAEVIALADASLTHFNSSQLIELAETSCYGTHNLKLIGAKDNVCVKKASN